MSHTWLRVLARVHEGSVMNSFVEAGQILAGRYKLTEPFSEQPLYPGVQAWNAVDTLLGTSLRILALDPGNSNASEVLDAARRSSLIDDPHVVRILSVGEDPAAYYVATEIPLGTPLSAYLHGIPVAPRQAQALTGEVASALNSARARGVRHLELTPQQVRVGVLGEVFIDGLGTDAALASLRTDSMSSSQADRMESRGISILLARLLTGNAKAKPDAVLRMATENGSLPDALRSACTRELRGLGALSPADLVRELAPWGSVEPSEFPSVGEPHGSDSDVSAQAGAQAAGAAFGEASGAERDADGVEHDANGASPAPSHGASPQPGIASTGDASSGNKVDPLSGDAVKSAGMKPKWSSLNTFAEEHPEAVDPSATAIFHPEDFGDAPEGDYVTIADGPEDLANSAEKTIETAAVRDKKGGRDKKSKKKAGAAKGGAAGKSGAAGKAAAEATGTSIAAGAAAGAVKSAGAAPLAAAKNASGAGKNGKAQKKTTSTGKPSGQPTGKTPKQSNSKPSKQSDSSKKRPNEQAAQVPDGSLDNAPTQNMAAAAAQDSPAQQTGRSSGHGESQLPPSFFPASEQAANAASSDTVQIPTAQATSQSPWLLGEAPSPQQTELPGAELAGEEIEKPLYNPSKVVVALAILLIVVFGLWAVFKFFSPTSVPSNKSSSTRSLPATKAPSSQEKKPSASPTKEEKAENLPQPKVENITLLNPYGAQSDPSNVDEQENPSLIPYLTDQKTSTTWESYWYANSKYSGNKDGIGLAIKLSGKSKVTSVKIDSKYSGGKVEWRNSSASSPNTGDVIAESALKPNFKLSAPKTIATDTVVLWFPELSKQNKSKYRISIAEISVE